MNNPSRTVADRAQRERAIDVSASFIVRAPAGSGKTRLLIQRYLALLARVDEPEEIVAITLRAKPQPKCGNAYLMRLLQQTNETMVKAMMPTRYTSRGRRWRGTQNAAGRFLPMRRVCECKRLIR